MGKVVTAGTISGRRLETSRSVAIFRAVRTLGGWNSSATSRVPGSSIAQETGNQTTAPGNNVAVTNGYRIPDDRFHGYIGSAHGFRIKGLPFLVVGGYPRFQYGGYWFSPVDPWPEY